MYKHVFKFLYMYIYTYIDVYIVNQMDNGVPIRPGHALNCWRFTLRILQPALWAQHLGAAVAFMIF